MNESGFEIFTKTKSGFNIKIREMRFVDIYHVYLCIKNKNFTYPFLTGTSDPLSRPVRPLVRAINYVVMKAMASRYFGKLMFGARRHWLMTVECEKTNRFLGVVLVDAVVRYDDANNRHNSSYIETHKKKSDEHVGDGEWGFFLDPRYWGQGISIQAIYALSKYLSEIESWCQPTGPILRRVWAETGTSNTNARRVLEKAGMVEVCAKAIAPADSPRFDPYGNQIGLSHYRQPNWDSSTSEGYPIYQFLQDMESRAVVNPVRFSTSEVL